MIPPEVFAEINHSQMHVGHPRSPGHYTDIKHLIRYYPIYRKYEAMRPTFSVLDFISFVRKCCKNDMI